MNDAKPRKRTKHEWRAWLEYKLGEKIQPHKNEFVQFNADHGFFSFYIDWEDKTLFGHYLAGDAKYWLEWAKGLCRFLGLKKIQGYTEHNPRSATRLSGGRVIGYLIQIDVETEPEGGENIGREQHKNIAGEGTGI